jgi:hypothetical protein
MVTALPFYHVAQLSLMVGFSMWCGAFYGPFAPMIEDMWRGVPKRSREA